MSYKIIRYIDRLNDPALLAKPRARRIDQYVLQSSKILDEATDTVVSSIQYKLKTKSSLSKYKTSDFKLENLIESGAIENMKNTSLNRDNFTTYANISDMLSKIENNTNQSQTE